MAIYIIEIPHQRSATCWSRDTEQQIVTAVCAAMDQERSGAERPDTLDQAVEHLSRDLSRVILLRDDDEALATYIDGIDGHQGGTATAALRAALQRQGVLDDDGLTPAARTMALDLWREQLQCGLGQRGEEASDANLTDWLTNRTYTLDTLLRAARGDVAALAEARSEAGLPVLA